MKAGFLISTASALGFAAMTTMAQAEERIPNTRGAIDSHLQETFTNCNSSDTGACVISLQGSTGELYAQWRNSLARYLRATPEREIIGDFDIGAYSSQMDFVCYSLVRGENFASLKEAMNSVSAQSTKCLEKIETGLEYFGEVTTNVNFKDINALSAIAQRMNAHSGTQGPIGTGQRREPQIFDL